VPHRGRSVLPLAYGIGQRPHFVSSLRKDCCREVDACTMPCGPPGDAAHQRRSLDLASVCRGAKDNRRLRTSFGAAARCDGAAHCRYFTARPFHCPGFPGKHWQHSRLDAFVDCSIWRGPRASSPRCSGHDLQAEASATKCGWRASVPGERSGIRSVHELFRSSDSQRGLQRRRSHTLSPTVEGAPLWAPLRGATAVALRRALPLNALA
jgi:hypothetical protein